MQGLPEAEDHTGEVDPKTGDDEDYEPNDDVQGIPERDGRFESDYNTSVRVNSYLLTLGVSVSENPSSEKEISFHSHWSNQSEAYIFKKMTQKFGF